MFIGTRLDEQKRRRTTREVLESKILLDVTKHHLVLVVTFCSWTSIAIKHPYLGFIGAMSGLGRQVGFEQFSSSSKQGEYDCGAPKQRGVSKIKLTGNLNYHWDDGIPSLRQTIKQFFIRGLHESRNNMALHLC